MSQNSDSSLTPSADAASGPRRRSVQCVGPHGLHRMSYLEWGDARNPEVLVCVHGLTRNGRDFDDLARALAQEMGAALGQSVIVENRPGAGGTVGTGYVARAEADGTVMVAAAASHNIAGSLYTKLAYDPQKDFVPVSFIARSPFAILVDVNSPIQTIDESCDCLFIEARR